MAEVCIIGTGYVGLCTGLVFASRGHKVRFVDVDAAKLEKVKRGQAPFFEPGVDDLLQKLRGQYEVTTDAASAVRAASVTFLCVGTPRSADGAIDLTYIRQAARDVGHALKDAPRGHVVVVKSTVVPGTAEGVVLPEVAASSGLRMDEDVHVASNPEFLKEGTALADALEPDRIVVGARTKAAADRVFALYDSFHAPKITVSPATAEMIKYTANAFLATRIAFANEMANLCERIGIDWYDVVSGIGHDKRIGPHFLRAGVGFGGSCFPKDVEALATYASENGATSPLLENVLEHNDRQPLEAVRMLEEELGTLQGRRIALLGLAFKAFTDDVRETRALPIWRALTQKGADVLAYDPQAGGTFSRLEPRAKIAASLDEALRGADAVLLQTEWPEFRELPPDRFTTLMKTPIVVDGRRTFEPAALARAGVRYRAIGLGRGAVSR